MGHCSLCPISLTEPPGPVSQDEPLGLVSSAEAPGPFSLTAIGPRLTDGAYKPGFVAIAHRPCIKSCDTRPEANIIKNGKLLG